MRRLLEASDFIGKLGYDEEAEVEYLLDQAEKKILTIAEIKRSRAYESLKDGLDEAWERIEQLHKNKKKIRGVPTGYRELDNLLSGLQKSDQPTAAPRLFWKFEIDAQDRKRGLSYSLKCHYWSCADCIVLILK